MTKRNQKIRVFDFIQAPRSRLEGLSDGVFAVAMTLLILDIKLPPLPDHASATDFAQAVWALWPKVGVFISSFVILARAWELHRYVFTYIVRYDHILIYLNMSYLMAITFLPFTTSLVGEHSRIGTAAAIYVANFFAIAGLKLIMWSYATHKHRLVTSKLDMTVRIWLIKRLVLSLAVFTLVLLIAFVMPQVSILILLLYQMMMIIIPMFHQRLRAA